MEVKKHKCWAAGAKYWEWHVALVRASFSFKNFYLLEEDFQFKIGLRDFLPIRLCFKFSGDHRVEVGPNLEVNT